MTVQSVTIENIDQNLENLLHKTFFFDTPDIWKVQVLKPGSLADSPGMLSPRRFELVTFPVSLENYQITCLFEVLYFVSKAFDVSESSTNRSMYCWLLDSFRRYLEFFQFQDFQFLRRSDFKCAQEVHQSAVKYIDYVTLALARNRWHRIGSHYRSISKPGKNDKGSIGVASPSFNNRPPEYHKSNPSGMKLIARKDLYICIHNTSLCLFPGVLLLFFFS